MRSLTGGEARVDQWLWAVRVYPTRTAASDSCRGGHVRINGRPAKPSHAVRAGDTVEARAGDRRRILEVVDPITKRVGAVAAAACMVDRSPPPEPVTPAVFAEREASTGRPTKRDRRELDRLRGRR